MTKDSNAAPSPRRGASKTSPARAELCIPLTRREAKQFERIIKISGLSRKMVTRYLGSWATCALREFDSWDSYHPVWCLIDNARTYQSAQRVLQRMIDAVGPREHWWGELRDGRRWPDVK